MPPQLRIDIKPGMLPCNVSDIIADYVNLTSRKPEAGEEPYDHVGAMEFIVATLLVYCLLGISGLLVMRIKRRATRSHRTVTLREEYIQEYIKQADELRMSGYREKLKIETQRMMFHIQNIELQKSESVTRRVPDSFNDESTALFDMSCAGQGLRTDDDNDDNDDDSSITMISPYQYEVTQLPPLPEDYNDFQSLDEGVVTSSEYAPSGGTTSDISGIHFGTPKVNDSESCLLSGEFLRSGSNHLHIPGSNNAEDLSSSRSDDMENKEDYNGSDDSDTNCDTVGDNERNSEHLLGTKTQKRVNFS